MVSKEENLNPSAYMLSSLIFEILNNTFVINSNDVLADNFKFSSSFVHHWLHHQ